MSGPSDHPNRYDFDLNSLISNSTTPLTPPQKIEMVTCKFIIQSLPNLVFATKRTPKLHLTLKHIISKATTRDRSTSNADQNAAIHLKRSPSSADLNEHESMKYTVIHFFFFFESTNNFIRNVYNPFKRIVWLIDPLLLAISPNEFFDPIP